MIFLKEYKKISSNKDKRLIDLSCFLTREDEAFLIIAYYNTGIIYTNQTHGTYCAHPEIEGFAFININIFGLEEIKEYIYKNIDYGIPSEKINEINKIFEDYTLPFRIDEDRKKESGEAWLFVIYEENIIHNSLKYSGLKDGDRCVISWHNSD